MSIRACSGMLVLNFLGLALGLTHGGIRLALDRSRSVLRLTLSLARLFLCLALHRLGLGFGTPDSLVELVASFLCIAKGGRLAFPS